MEETVRKPTLKQEKYAKAYLETGNKTEAAMIAYNNSSRRNANIMAQEVHKKPAVQRAIRELQENLQEHLYDCLVKTDAVDRAIASAITDLEDNDGKIRDAARRFIGEIMKNVRDESVKINKHLHARVDWPQRN